MSNYVNKVNSDGNIYYISDLEARNSIEAIEKTLETKVDKIDGKALSTNDLTNELKTEYDNAVAHSKAEHARVDATAVTSSSVNGNILINGAETTVYTHPDGTNPHGTTARDLGLDKVGNFKAVSTEENQGLSHLEKENARANIGAGTSSFSGQYDDLTGKPEALPASDVHPWAKEETKPEYTAAEVGLGNVGNFKAVSVEAGQSLDNTEKENARANINAQVAGDYAAEVHEHTVSEITDFPELGTASAKNVATTGDASATQVVMGNDSRLTDARKASDVYAWAKEETKPTYTAAEVGLGNVGNFKAVSTVNGQSLTATEQSNARANINAQVAGDYAAEVHEHTVSEITDFPTSLPASDVPAWAKATTKPSYTASEVGAIPATLKGAANGVAELDSTGKVPAAQLPSYVDDVIEGYLKDGKFYKESSYTTQITGETGKIYVDLSSSKTYRWSGSAFSVISETLALGETSSTAYRGDRGATAYAHSQADHAPANAEKNQNAFSNVTVGSTTVAADTVTDTITLVAGDNVTIAADATNDTITISAKDTTYTLGSFGVTATAAELNYVDGVTSNIQSQLDGKAATSHGTHVSYDTAAPKAAGTASTGSASTVSRSDHVHPVQTSVSGNAGTATKLATARTFRTNLGSTSTASFDGSENATPGVTGTLALGNGGTGATTAAAARTNLGLANTITIAYADEDDAYKVTL